MRVSRALPTNTLPYPQKISTSTQKFNFQPFKADWPESLKPQWYDKPAHIAWNIFSIIVFPIGLVRLGNYAFQKIGEAAIHPATWMHADKVYRVRRELFAQGGKIVQFMTPDDEKLQAMFFKGTSPSKKTILFTPGNGECMDLASGHFIKFVRKYVGNVNVLVLNYRGVQGSTGSSSPEGLPLDAYSAAEYMHKEHKINPSRIFFYGHSLGGYAGVKGAALFQKQHPESKISAASDRSFSALSHVAAAIAGFILGLVGKLWELDARDDLSDLKGRKLVIYDKKDGVIPYPVSFFEAIRNRPVAKNVTAIELISKGKDVEDAHNRSFNHKEAQRIGREIRLALA